MYVEYNYDDNIINLMIEELNNEEIKSSISITESVLLDKRRVAKTFKYILKSNNWVKLVLFLVNFG